MVQAGRSSKCTLSPNNSSNSNTCAFPLEEPATSTATGRRYIKANTLAQPRCIGKTMAVDAWVIRRLQVD